MRNIDYMKRLIELLSYVPRHTSNNTRNKKFKHKFEAIRWKLNTWRDKENSGRQELVKSIKWNSMRCTGYSISTNKISSSGIKCSIKKSWIGRDSINSFRLHYRLCMINNIMKKIRDCNKSNYTEFKKVDTVNNNSLRDNYKSKKIHSIMLKSKNTEN